MLESGELSAALTRARVEQARKRISAAVARARVEQARKRLERVQYELACAKVCCVNP